MADSMPSLVWVLVYARMAQSNDLTIHSLVPILRHRGINNTPSVVSSPPAAVPQRTTVQYLRVLHPSAV